MLMITSHLSDGSGFICPAEIHVTRVERNSAYPQNLKIPVK